MPPAGQTRAHFALPLVVRPSGSYPAIATIALARFSPFVLVTVALTTQSARTEGEQAAAVGTADR